MLKTLEQPKPRAAKTIAVTQYPHTLFRQERHSPEMMLDNATARHSAEATYELDREIVGALSARMAETR